MAFEGREYRCKDGNRFAFPRLNLLILPLREIPINATFCDDHRPNEKLFRQSEHFVTSVVPWTICCNVNSPYCKIHRLVNVRCNIFSC